MSDVVTFGEIMLRLTPPGRQRFVQAPHFEITFGGAEANVAVMLAQLGASASFITKLPENELAQRAINELRGLGVNTSGIVRGGDRMGVYFLEQGASQRGGKVIYDRAGSAVAEAQPGDFDWEEIFDQAEWLHWSGITPALSAAAASIAAEACTEARQRGLVISFDLNYRAKLWSCAEARRGLTPLMQHVDLCITSVEEARAVFGLTAEDAMEGQAAAKPPRGKGKRAKVSQAKSPLSELLTPEENAARYLMERFGFKMVALTMRATETADATSWGAMLFSENKAHFSRRHEMAVVDRVGAGDSFTGALIFALRRGDDPQRAIDFAVAASTLKHTISGDYNLVTLAEVEALAAGAGGGRVQR